ncbi:hypothetical protein DS832_07995 [Bombilactobacillus bombi]|uniref:Putative zinc-ribbon domain-containing protein n=1 Tax=Bombilactobacillus bombi TaxID=1303590 RepID=A0A417Z308_9LACO|nr:zinc ribbon domain-containing protein [Bombilactobacillus bombi]RHW45053.1 hypothetical protein DS832_07995 [Bombilactobacillus bombi]
MQNNVVCPNCGNYVAAEATTCPYCGVALMNTNYGYYDNNQTQSTNMTSNNFPKETIPDPTPDTSQNSTTKNDHVLEPLSLAGMLTGLLSLIVQFGGLTGGIAIVLSALALNKRVQRKNKALAIAGILLGIISIICFIVELMYLRHTLDSTMHLLSSLRGLIQQLTNH